MRLLHALRIILAQISTGIFRMEGSALRGNLSPLFHRVPIRRGMYRQLRERDVAWGMKRRMGMLENKSSLYKARGEDRRAKLVMVVIAEVAAATRTMMKRVRTAREMLTRQL